MSNNKNVCFIKGEVDIENRKNIFDLLEKQNNVICSNMNGSGDSCIK